MAALGEWSRRGPVAEEQKRLLEDLVPAERVQVHIGREYRT